MDIQMETMLQGGQFKKLLEGQCNELRLKYDMKRAELEILYYLSRCGQQNTSTDIHRQLSMNRGHVSQAVDSLCKRNLIIAIPDQNDRRYVHYEITSAAQEIISEIVETRKKMTEQILDGISEEELRVFCQVSFKIKNNMEKMI